MREFFVGFDLLPVCMCSGFGPDSRQVVVSVLGREIRFLKWFLEFLCPSTLRLSRSDLRIARFVDTDRSPGTTQFNPCIAEAQATVSTLQRHVSISRQCPLFRQIVTSEHDHTHKSILAVKLLKYTVVFIFKMTGRFCKADIWKR